MTVQACETLLSVRGLTKHYAPKNAPHGTVQRAVDDVSFTIRAGEAFGLVGESGSGKSTIGRAITMLNAPTAGVIEFEGRDLRSISASQLRQARRHLQIIFQDPNSSLNPRMKVGDFVAEPLEIHGLYPDKKVRRAYVEELFRRVGLEPQFTSRYPHEFSGGQRQRICIARALALRPRLIVADEPIAALDVSIQAQIVNLLQDLQEEFGLAYLFISHDLRMVRHLCQRVAVLWRGQIVEMADADALFDRPSHPYTRRLLAANPIADPDKERERKPLSPLTLEGAAAAPGLREIAPGHFSRGE